MYIQSVNVLISAEIYNRIISFQYYFRITYVYPIFDDKDAVFSGKTNARVIIHRGLFRINIYFVFPELLSKLS